jgi:hypothetical protein
MCLQYLCKIMSAVFETVGRLLCGILLVCLVGGMIRLSLSLSRQFLLVPMTQNVPVFLTKRAYPAMLFIHEL